MNTYNIPIYTEFAECQDCYKCVRECPVKAIKIEDFHASIIPDLCIQCGHCVEVCPVNAKQVRDDFSRVKAWIELGKKITISLAPSWVTEFPDLSEREMIKRLKEVGFDKVSETAIGAEIVNSEILKLNFKNQLYISTACPTVVSLINGYYPELSGNLLNLTSPLIAHCKMLKSLDPENMVVFAGPCFAKKIEADDNNELLQAAISFGDLQTLFVDAIENHEIKLENQNFYPRNAEEGRIYPIEGGMLEGLLDQRLSLSERFHSFTGIDTIKAILDDIENFETDEPLLLELMACKGGCINGPGVIRKTSEFVKRFELIKRYKNIVKKTDLENNVRIDVDYKPIVKSKVKYTENQIQEIFYSIGKYRPEDQHNCGGCGYCSCREFAIAILNGMAESGMCVSFLRKRAQKKANALFRRMPSGAIIVDKDLRIVDSNKNFYKILKLDGYIFDEEDGFEGAQLERLIDFDKMFKQVLETNCEILDKELHFNGAIVNISIFVIEPKQLIGAIVQDITEPSVMRETTIRKARKVISKNLDMVQKIAYLLGENAAEVEITLNSIIDVSAPEKLKDEIRNEK
jgi:iron only hydrogenase large subunit-like protein